MSQTPITITYLLEAILTRIEGKIDTLQRDVNQKFDTLQKDVTDFLVEMTEVKTEVRNLKEDVSELKTAGAKIVTDIADLKGFKSLIIPIIVAFVSAIVTVGFRAFFMSNNP